MGPEAVQLAYPSQGNVNCTLYYIFREFFIARIDLAIYCGVRKESGPHQVNLKSFRRFGGWERNLCVPKTGGIVGFRLKYARCK